MMANYSEQFRNEKAEEVADYVRSAIKEIAYSNQNKGLGKVVFCYAATSLEIDLREVTRGNRAEFNYVGRMTDEFIKIHQPAQQIMNAILALSPEIILSLYKAAAPLALGYEAFIYGGTWSYKPFVFA